MDSKNTLPHTSKHADSGRLPTLASVGIAMWMHKASRSMLHGADIECW